MSRSPTPESSIGETKAQKRFKRLKSFLEFSEFWLRVKTDSKHGVDVNKTIIKETKQQLRQAERLAMSDKRAKHILVVVDGEFENNGLILSVLDRFVSQHDMILMRSYHPEVLQYADDCGCVFALYEEIPDTINFVLAFAKHEDFVESVNRKSAEIGKIVIIAKCP